MKEKEKESGVPTEIQVQKLKEFGESTWREFLGEERVLKLLLADPVSARQNIQKAWSLYHSAKTAIQFGETHRAVWYIVSFRKFCDLSFSNQAVMNATKTIEAWLE